MLEMSTVSEMDKFEIEAKEWTKCSSVSYGIKKDESENILKIYVDEDSRKLEINITCPTSTKGKFSVMSECQDFLPHLSVVIDYCDSAREKTLTMILDKLDDAVKNFQRCTAENEEDDDDEDDEGYDFDDDTYYGNDEDAEKDTQVIQKEDSDDDLEETFFGGKGNPAAFHRLTSESNSNGRGITMIGQSVMHKNHNSSFDNFVQMTMLGSQLLPIWKEQGTKHGHMNARVLCQDLKNMKKEAHKFGILGTPRGDNLFLWDVKLTGFDKGTKLGQDIEQFAQKYNREPVVYLEMQFPGEYPMLPPFVRVIRPRFKFLTGHVTIGGSICMQMLTKSGWTPSNDIESILVQIRSEIMSDPNARLDSQPDREYSEAEARDAFNRMVTRYGWS